MYAQLNDLFAQYVLILNLKKKIGNKLEEVLQKKKGNLIVVGFFDELFFFEFYNPTLVVKWKMFDDSQQTKYYRTICPIHYIIYPSSSNEILNKIYHP